MTKLNLTGFGEPLSTDAQKLVNEVRSNAIYPIHSRKNHKHNKKDLVENASKALNRHLRLRKCLRLDEIPDIPFSENPIFQRRYLPCGKIDEQTDKSNRLLWFIEYETISVEYIAHGMKSSEACRYQFWQFEHMLRREAATGRLSSLRHVIDMNNYEINPFTMVFVSSGTLSYYSQLFHYDNYPELVNPIELVNIARWIHVPYRIIKAMMPSGFADRFRLHDGHFLTTLSTEIDIEHVPETLGGKDPERKCIPAIKLAQSDYWTPLNRKIIDSLETIHISARKMKYYHIEVEATPQILSWYFATDGDIYFGIFYEADKSPELDIEEAEMIYPYLKLTAKLVHEFDAIKCEKAGHYYVVFSNKHSWMKGRSIDAMVQIRDDKTLKRVHNDCHLETITDEKLDIVQHLNLEPHPVR